MLILTRKIGESIIIGDDVVVKVMAVNGGQLKLGIDAPKNVSVHREEIYRRIQAEKNGEETNYNSNIVDFNVMGLNNG